MIAQNLYTDFLAKTTTYQVKPEDIGRTITNRGSTANFTCTLPPLPMIPTGFWIRFFGVSAYGFVIASSGSSDNIVGKNDAGADTITMTTTSLMIGASVYLEYDGTGWLSTVGAGPTYTYA